MPVIAGAAFRLHQHLEVDQHGSVSRRDDILHVQVSPPEEAGETEEPAASPVVFPDFLSVLTAVVQHELDPPIALPFEYSHDPVTRLETLADRPRDKIVVRSLETDIARLVHKPQPRIEADREDATPAGVRIREPRIHPRQHPGVDPSTEVVGDGDAVRVKPLEQLPRPVHPFLGHRGDVARQDRVGEEERAQFAAQHAQDELPVASVWGRIGLSRRWLLTTRLPCRLELTVLGVHRQLRVGGDFLEQLPVEGAMGRCSDRADRGGRGLIEHRTRGPQNRHPKLQKGRFLTRPEIPGPQGAVR